MFPQQVITDVSLQVLLTSSEHARRLRATSLHWQAYNDDANMLMFSECNVSHVQYLSLAC